MSYKTNKQRPLPGFLKIILLAMVLVPGLMFSGTAVRAQEEEEEELYLENEWNFVEGTMDTSGGIPDNAGGVLERIKKAGKLRVATDPYWVPAEFIDPSKKGQERFVGADMELAKLIAERMGVELEIIPMDFAEVLPALDEDLCDLTISALAFTPGRAADWELSRGYYYGDDYTAQNGIMVREEDLPYIRNIDDLGGRSIAAQSGSVQEALGVENIIKYKEFRRVPTIRSVYIALSQYQADAAIVNIGTAEEFIKDKPYFHLAIVPGVRFDTDPQYQGDRIAAKKGEIKLLYFVNSILNEVVESGQYDRWYEEYEAYADTLGM